MLTKKKAITNHIALEIQACSAGTPALDELLKAHVAQA